MRATIMHTATLWNSYIPAYLRRSDMYQLDTFYNSKSYFEIAAVRAKLVKRLAIPVSYLSSSFCQ